MKKHIWHHGLTGLLLAASSLVSHAQDGPSKDDSVYAVEVKPDDRLPEGRSAFLQGEADAAGQRFSVGDLDLDRPVVISVLTQHPGEKVRVRLVKDDWNSPERDEETNDQQRADFKFRTFDGFKIWITAATPTPYQLIVWVGDKIQLPLVSIAVPASEYRDGETVAAASASQPRPAAAPAEPAAPPETEATAAGGRGGVSLSYLELGLIAALLLIVIAFGAFMLTRRKPGA